MKKYVQTEFLCSNLNEGKSIRYLITNIYIPLIKVFYLLTFQIEEVRPSGELFISKRVDNIPEVRELKCFQLLYLTNHLI